MAQRRKSFLWAGALSCFLIAGFGFWILVNPGNGFTKAFQSSISTTNSRVITGPYPVISDFRELRSHGVTTVVSLLDPNIPYEHVLLDKEQKNARHFGMRFYNFPMASILGCRMGDDYTTNAEKAAHFIDSLSSEHIYVHCYLGLHRITAVRNLLASAGIQAGSYTEHQTYRPKDAADFDSAIYYYQANNLKATVRKVSSMKEPTAPALLLRGWSYYHLLELSQAEQDFRTVLKLQPELYDAECGLGYCNLEEGHADSARTCFSQALAADPHNSQAEAGMGMIEFRDGDQKAARTYLEASLASDSTNMDARNMLSRIGRTQ